MKHTIKELVKDNNVHFESLRQGVATYFLSMYEKGYSAYYKFPVPLNDIGEATLKAHEKAIFYMRWIGKAIEDGTITEIIVTYDETD